MVGSHDLATLVLSDDGQEATYKIHAHSKVDLDPKKLYEIGENFSTQ